MTMRVQGNWRIGNYPPVRPLVQGNTTVDGEPDVLFY